MNRAVKAGLMCCIASVLTSCDLADAPTESAGHALPQVPEPGSAIGFTQVADPLFLRVRSDGGMLAEVFGERDENGQPVRAIGIRVWETSDIGQEPDATIFFDDEGRVSRVVFQNGDLLHKFWESEEPQILFEESESGAEIHMLDELPATQPTNSKTTRQDTVKVHLDTCGIPVVQSALFLPNEGKVIFRPHGCVVVRSVERPWRVRFHDLRWNGSLLESSPIARSDTSLQWDDICDSMHSVFEKVCDAAGHGGGLASLCSVCMAIPKAEAAIACSRVCNAPAIICDTLGVGPPGGPDIAEGLGLCKQIEDLAAFLDDFPLPGNEPIDIDLVTITVEVRYSSPSQPGRGVKYKSEPKQVRLFGPGPLPEYFAQVKEPECDNESEVTLRLLNGVGFMWFPSSGPPLSVKNGEVSVPLCSLFLIAPETQEGLAFRRWNGDTHDGNILLEPCELGGLPLLNNEENISGFIAMDKSRTIEAVLTPCETPRMDYNITVFGRSTRVTVHNPMDSTLTPHVFVKVVGVGSWWLVEGGAFATSVGPGQTRSLWIRADDVSHFPGHERIFADSTQWAVVDDGSYNFWCDDCSVELDEEHVFRCVCDGMPANPPPCLWAVPDVTHE